MSNKAASLNTSPRVSSYVTPQNIITQMQSGHGFTTTNGDASSNLNDTSNFVIGTQAATLVTQGTGLTTYLLHKGLPAVDMTNKQYVVVLECDDLTHISSGSLQFYAGTGASSSTTYQWKLAAGGTIDQNLIQKGNWIYIVLNFADATISGSPVRSAITDYYIHIADDNTGNKVTVRLNAIYAIPDSNSQGGYGVSYPNGVVSVCLDDGFSSQWTNAKPYLDTNNIPPSAFVIWDQIGNTGRMTLSQYLTAQDICGWDIHAHSMTDYDHAQAFDNITTAELEANIQNQTAIMAAQGFQGQGSAYPKGQLTPTVRTVLRRFFQFVRGTSNVTLETLPPSDVFNLRAVSSISPLSGGYSPSLITASGTGLIDQTVTNHRWLILVFHKIIGNVTSMNNTTGTTYRIVYSDTTPPYNTGTSITTQGFTPSGLNGTFTVTGSGTTGGFGYCDVNVGSTPGNATVMGTALSATTDLDLATFQAIINKIVSSGVAVKTMSAVFNGLYANTGAAPITKSANYTMNVTDGEVFVDATSAAITITLPDATKCIDGRTRSIKDWKGKAATHNITIATTGGQTIDGLNTKVMAAGYQNVTLKSDGSNWSIL